ncbi:MAG: NAD-dependent epimerase/dehydratase family protein [Candidatus Acidiferrales bacterium]
MKIDIYSRTNQRIVDCLVFGASFIAAYLIRFEGLPSGADLRQMLLWLPIVVFARLAVHLILGIYRLVWRFVSFSDAIELAKSIAIVSACLTALRLFVTGNGQLAVWARLPLSVIVLDGLLALTASMGIRALRRLLYSVGRRTAADSGTPGKRVVLYGAGRAGIMLSKELENNTAYDLLGFVDDDPRKAGSVIGGTRVLGHGDELAQLAVKYRLDEIIVSMASANAEILACVLAKCRRANVAAKVMPSVREMLNGQVRINQVRETDIRPVLVLGGAGYIGCWLVKRLLEQGRRVRIMDNAVYGLEPIHDLLAHPNLEHLNGDCRNIQDVVKAMSGVSRVVHLAAIVGDPACEIDRKTTIEINYAATRMLVEIAKGYGVERFLFASSCSVYGATDELMDEESPVGPISLYGETKISSEQALLKAADDDFHPVLMRFATVFGLTNRPRFDLVVNLLSAKASQDHVITIFNGQQWRPFVHVKDLAEAMILLLAAPLPAVSRQVFNVGDNRLNHTLGEVAQVIQRIIPGTRVEYVENSDRRNYRVRFDKIEKQIGFRCRYSLEDGVREIKSAFESGLINNYRNIQFSNQTYLRESGAPGNKSDFDAQVMAAFGGEQIAGPMLGENPVLHLKAKAAALGINNAIDRPQ